MAKGYMLSAHRAEADPTKREAYVKLAGPALEAAGLPVDKSGCIYRLNGILESITFSSI